MFESIGDLTCNDGDDPAQCRNPCRRCSYSGNYSSAYSQHCHYYSYHSTQCWNHSTSTSEHSRRYRNYAGYTHRSKYRYHCQTAHKTFLLGGRSPFYRRIWTRIQTYLNLSSGTTTTICTASANASPKTNSTRLWQANLECPM